MKKIKLISASLVGLSLAAGSILSIATTNKKVEPVRAEADIIMIGNHDLIANHEYNGEEGTATLDISDSQYTITLDNFMLTSDAYVDDYGNYSSGLTILNVSRAVVIKAIGDNFISNDVTTKTYCYGLYAHSTNENASLSIIGLGEDATLLIQASQMSNGTSVGFCSDIGDDAITSVDNITFSAVSDLSQFSFGMRVDGEFHVGQDAIISSTSVGALDTVANNYSVGAEFKKYVQNGGYFYAVARGGEKKTYTYGMQVQNEMLFNGGELSIETSSTGDRENHGLHLENGGLTVKGDKLSIKTGYSLSNESYGIYLCDYNDSNFIDIKSDSSSVYVYANNHATNADILSESDGYVDDEEDIYSSTSAEKFTKNVKTSTSKKTILFDSIVYDAEACEAVSYDGKPHKAINLTVTNPESPNYTVKYSIDNGSNWSDAVPSLTNAGDYLVKYEITSKYSETVAGSVNFKIKKVAASVTNAPTLIDAFTADGKDHALVNEGTADGGVLVYSINGGEYKESIPTVKDAGTYTISYKVKGDNNHDDTEIFSLGSVVVAANPNQGLGAGAVIGIVLGSIVALVGISYLVLFFLVNKWIKVEGKAVRVMRFALGSKDGKTKYLTFKCKLISKDKNEVFNSKEEALK